MTLGSGQIADTLCRLDSWIEGEGFKGWDPYDALNSPLLGRLTFGSRLLGIAWVQLFKRSPVNLRPLMGVPKGYNPKGMGLFLASYWRKYLLTGQKGHLDRVRFFADWLRANASPNYSGACWGYNFPWPNRGFFAPAGTPTIVNTAFIGLAFLDLLTLPDSGRTVGQDSQALPVAREACEFVLNDLNTTCPEPDERCFSYTPLDRRFVHNANVLGAWLLAEVGTLTSESGLVEAALAAARYTVRRQRDDGSWVYGEGAKDGWVDNFHTGFVLVALKRIAARLDINEFDDAVARGYRFWRERMFLLDGTPRYYPDRIYPVDVHCVAQAILTFLEFADQDPQAGERAWNVASWGVRHMQDPRGYFHYQIHHLYRIRIPYLRWSQAWMQRALTELLWKDEGQA